MPKKISYIECELKLWYLTISWKSEWVRGFLNVKILRGGEAQAVLEFQVEGGGGRVKKKTGLLSWGVDFF